MKVYNRVTEVSFHVDGISVGKISISRRAKWLSASGGCKRFIPDGKTFKNHPSYSGYDDPTVEQIAEVMSSIAEYEGYNVKG